MKSLTRFWAAKAIAKPPTPIPAIRVVILTPNSGSIVRIAIIRIITPVIVTRIEDKVSVLFLISVSGSPDILRDTNRFISLGIRNLKTKYKIIATPMITTTRIPVSMNQSYMITSFLIVLNTRMDYNTIT
jgi:hypothetical protein